MTCYLSCSQKVREGAGVAVAMKMPWPDSAASVFRWRVDLYDERQSSAALMFTNAETLYSYFVVKDGPNRFEDAFVEFVERLAGDLLRIGGIDVGNSHAMQFTGTAARSLIASTNNLMEMASLSLERGREVEASINSMPCGSLDYALPAEEWVALIERHATNGS